MGKKSKAKKQAIKVQVQKEEPQEELSAFQIKERNNRTIFVGNLPLEASERKLTNFFSKAIGSVEKVSLFINEHADSGTKYAHILCEDQEIVDKAITELHQELFMKSHIRVKKLRVGDNQVMSTSKKVNFTETVMVGNLPLVLSEEEIKAHFSSCGPIQNVKLMRDSKTLLGKGYGYILFEDEKGMQKAISTMNNQPFKGNTLIVKQSVEKKEKEEKVPKMKNTMNQVKKIQKLLESSDSEVEEKEKAESDEEGKENYDFSTFGGPQAPDYKFENNFGYNKKKTQNMMLKMRESMQEKGKGEIAKCKVQTQHKKLFVRTSGLAEILKKRIAKRREQNIKKFNSGVKIKKFVEPKKGK